MADTTTAPTAPTRDGLWQRLTTGRANIDFIGRSALWAKIIGALLLLIVVVLVLRGLNFGIEFTGGTSFTVTNAAGGFTGDEIRDALAEAGVDGAQAQVVDGGEGALVTTPALGEIGGAEQAEIVAALASVTGADADDVAVSAVGPRWGAQVTRQAFQGLVVFLIIVVAYISLRFEWRMALSALVTLLHDIVMTVGIYSLVGFEVTPASVIAFLTILGYSLYDTVVVFDRVQEDTANLSSVSTTTYGESANRALNEVLLRSLSTAMTSLLPVASLLFIGATLLGAETLKDLALALFVGMLVGAYSSIFVATPMLVFLKEREPKYAELKQRVQSRRTPGAATATAGAGASAAAGTAPAPSGDAPATPSTPAAKTAPRGGSANKRKPRHR